MDILTSVLASVLVSVLVSVTWANVIVTLFILSALIAVPYLDRRYAPAGRYVFWVFVMAGMVLPFFTAVAPQRVLIPVTVSLPAGSFHETSAVFEASVGYEASAGHGVPRGEPGAVLPDVHEVNQTESSGAVQHSSPYSPRHSSPYSPSSSFSPPLSPSHSHSPLHSLPYSQLLPLETDSVTAVTTRVISFVSGINIISTITTGWLIGMIVFAFIQAIRHLRLVRFVKRWRIPVHDENASEILRGESARLGITRDIPLIYVKNIAAPMLMGLVRPAVYMPDGEYSQSELRFIFRHELIHYKRRDLWYKLALTAVRCLYWYNPAAHLMARQANKDIETLCDDFTIRGMDMDARKSYSNLILRMTAEPAGATVTTYFSGGKRMLKQRLSNILNADGKKRGRFIATAGLVLLVVSVITGLNFYAAQGNPDYTAYEATGEAAVNENASGGYNEPAGTDERILYSTTERALERELDRELERLGRESEPFLRERERLVREAERLAREAERQVREAERRFRVERQTEDAAGRQHEDTQLRAVSGANHGGTGRISFDEVAERRSAAGLLPYSGSYDELRALVFSSPVRREHVFDGEAVSLHINTIYDNVRITRGGEHLTIRYYEWLEGHYLLREYGGHVTLDALIPFYFGEPVGSQFRNATLIDGIVSHDAWLVDYLNYRDSRSASHRVITNRLPVDHPIEIIIPEGMMPLITVYAPFGSLIVRDITLENLTANMSFGNTGLINAEITTGEINSAFGEFTMNRVSFTDMNVNVSFGTGYIGLNDNVSAFDITTESAFGTATLGGRNVSRDELRNPSARSRLNIDAGFGRLSMEDTDGTVGSGVSGGAFEGFRNNTAHVGNATNSEVKRCQTRK